VEQRSFINAVENHDLETLFSSPEETINPQKFIKFLGFMEFGRPLMAKSCGLNASVKNVLFGSFYNLFRGSCCFEVL